MGPPRAGMPGPFYANGTGAQPAALAVAPTIAAPSRSDIRQVADWPASGETATRWRPVQRPGDVTETGNGGAWKETQHVSEPPLATTPAIVPQPAALSDALRGPEPAALHPPVQPLVKTHHFGPQNAIGPVPAPHETHQVSLPPYRVGPPDILLVESTEGVKETQLIRGQHLVRPDGTINVGIYGSVYVNGMTTDQVREAVSRAIHARVPNAKFEDVLNNTSVDVIAYNSQVYYVITDGGGFGEQVVAVPVTGRETVLDALAKINGLSPVSSRRHIWVARRVGDGNAHEQKLPVDWIGITQHGQIETNYQIMPGDRVYVKADRMRTFDTNLAKFLSPVERLFGVTLLSSQAINSIRSGTTIGGVGR
jgi:polysaccharide export outer membrane protein